ncbi:hypothetical protein TWF730_008712 [Orbilia blumenaviensis]|uniref:Uncharacterized protein n=1 Tax=Orbilia blumenaviensis TaxID=1796055 RepID=A0AAV9V5S1_9PEZI
MATRLGIFMLGAAVRQRGLILRPVARHAPSRYVRFSSSGSSSSPSPSPATGASEPKKKSPHVGFYQIYGRALSKVILMSLLVYQGFYYGWMYLEHLEVKHKKDGEIQALEQRISDLQQQKAQSQAQAQP